MVRPREIPCHRQGPLEGPTSLPNTIATARLLRRIHGDGYTLEFMGSTLLCLDISDPTGMARLLAGPVKEQLPVGV